MIPGRAMLRLTRLREERGWSRAELARRAKIYPTDVGKIERGKLVPYPGQLRRLARALGHDGAPEELLTEHTIHAA